MKRSFSALFEELDQLIRKGDGEIARTKLGKIRPAQLPAGEKKVYARLALRLHSPTLTLRALGPIVRPTSRRTLEPTVEERALYAAALNQVGACEEACELLEQLDGGKYPDVFLYHAFSLFSQWNYELALAPLERYVASPGLEEYWYLVGLANLASARVFQRRPEALSTIKELMERTSPENYRILYGYGLQLEAEEAIWRHSWKEAKEKIKVARGFFSDPESLDVLILRKWEAIIEVYESSSRTSARLSSVQSDATKRQHWETLRSIDYHLAVARKDAGLLTKFLFGTPFQSLCEKLRREFGSEATPDHYEWELVPGALPRVYRLGEGSGALKPGSVQDRLLKILALDFYRPLRVAEIHSRLFPGEFFNPDSSPARINQVLARLRGAWKKLKWPLRVEENQGAYRLSCEVPCRIYISSEERKLGSASDLRFRELYEAFGDKSFDAKAVTRCLKISTSSAKRLLNEALSASAVAREGKGRATRYRFGK